MKLLISSRHRTNNIWLKLAICAAVLILAAYFGPHASSRWLGLLVIGIAVAVLLHQPILGLLALVVAALVIPLEFGTGTEVMLNLATLLMPALVALWVLDMVRRRDLRMVPSPTNAPLSLFLLAGLLSLLVGSALWDPTVPRPSSFTIVQLAQWAIFVFSAGAFWLTGNLVHDQAWLRRLTFVFLALGGSLAILRVLPWGTGLVSRIATIALTRAPFWVLLAALAGGQLLFNRGLSAGWRLFLVIVLAAVVVYAFFQMREALANWAGVVAVAGALAWLRWPRLRWAFIGLTALGLVVFWPAVYSFAGGEAEWAESGGSRLALIRRVVEVTMRNPITGLGPAAYRAYARTRPLLYGRAFYLDVNVSSHNNYVDLFSHTGLLGLGLFLWSAAELTMLGLQLRARFAEGFACGYVNAMLATWAGALVLMLLLDWILPFVYNVGFPGFQASVLVWLFLGGLVALENMKHREMSMEADCAT